MVISTKTISNHGLLTIIDHTHHVLHSQNSGAQGHGGHFIQYHWMKALGPYQFMERMPNNIHYRHGALNFQGVHNLIGDFRPIEPRLFANTE